MLESSMITQRLAGTLLVLLLVPLAAADDEPNPYPAGGEDGATSSTGDDLPCPFLAVRPHEPTSPVGISQTCLMDWVQFVVDLVPPLP
jgi:hypothetical protein